jgi:hypothetical protein
MVNKLLLIGAMSASLVFSQDTTTPRTMVDTGNRDFESIGASEFLSLTSSWEGNIPGLRLQCNFGETRAGSARFVRAQGNQTITFCEDDCSERATPNSSGPTVSLECANYIDAHIRACVEAMGCVSDVQFCGVGGHADRPMNTPEGGSTSPSRHSSGDALDLFGVKCQRRTHSGRLENFQLKLSSEGRAQHQEAYDAFLECWREAMENSEPRAAGHKGAIACEGAEPPNNHKHNDHIHLSCPTPRTSTGGT